MVLPTATQLGRSHWEPAHRLSFSSWLSKAHLAGGDQPCDKIAVETAQTTKIRERNWPGKGKHAVVEEQGQQKGVC